MLMDTIKSPAANLLMQPSAPTQVAAAPVAPASPTAPMPALSPSEQWLADQEAAERKRVLDFQNQWQRDNSSAPAGVESMDLPDYSSNVRRFTTFKSPTGMDRLKQMLLDSEAYDPNLDSLPVAAFKEWSRGVDERRRSRAREPFQFPPL